MGGANPNGSVLDSQAQNTDAQNGFQSIKPNVIRGSEVNGYRTPLTPQQEASYQMYRVNLGDQNNDQNYDLRGYWLNNVYMKNNGEHIPGDHFSDFYKKPNHPTFSDESQYSVGKPAGHWVGNHAFRPPAGADINTLRIYLQSPEGEGMSVQDVK
jgi:hypothetical protein